MIDFALWWHLPGVSEFAAAIAGSMVGAASGGVISWRLQKADFEWQQAQRMKDKRATDLAHLQATFLTAMRAASDLNNYEAIVIESAERAAKMEIPPIPGLSRTWLGLLQQATFPNPVSVSTEALAVFMDKGRADLAMQTLRMVAEHDDAIKLWQSFSDSRQRFGEKIALKTDPAGQTSMTLTHKEIEQNYPHMKELSDLAQAIRDRATSQAEAARALAKLLADFITETAGKKLEVTFDIREPPVFSEDAPPSKKQSRAAGPLG